MAELPGSTSIAESTPTGPAASARSTATATATAGDAGSDVLRTAGRGGVVDTAHVPVEHEKPEDWGWHADFGRLGRAAGWVTVLALLSMISATHYNNSGTGALLIIAGLMVVGLLRDARKRRTSWRRPGDGGH